ncbi:snf2/rad54 helicase family [Holotrichia oblita]|nr:snf2/rad54 helicase family [Holotrichia oblita]
MLGDDRVELEPIFCVTEGVMPYLRFKVGRSRRYGIKKIADFLSAIVSASTVRYGAGLKFRHNEASFTKESNILIGFLLKCRKDRLSLGGIASMNKDEFPLTFGELDEFISLYFGKSLSYYENNSLAGVRKVFSGEDIRPVVSIKEEQNGYTMAAVTQKSHILEGRSHCYYITENCIYRCGLRLWEVAAPLFAALKKGSLFVSKSDMPVFYNNVLLQAGEELSIDADGIDLSGFEAPAFTAALYLDGDKEILEGTLKCSYGDTEIDIIAGDIGALTYRDWETENKLKTVLARYFPYYPRLHITENADIYVLYKEGLESIYNFADIFISEALSPVKIRKAPRVTAGIRLNAGLLELDFSNTDYSEQELKALTAAYKGENKYVRLSDGSFIDISDDSVGALSNLLLLGDRKGKKLILPAYYAPVVEEKIRDGYLTADTDYHYGRMVEGFENYKKMDFDFAGLDKTLRSYQKEGVKWLKMLKNNRLGGILADDMGLGKTLQMLTILSEHNKGVSIVVCPTSLIINWGKEAEQFTPHLKTLQVMGSTKDRTEMIAAIKNYDIVITSYELFKRDEHLYSGIEFEIAILDEAQYIKNHETKNARAVKKLSAVHKFALTGTPIENSLSELWSIFDFLMPGYLFSYGKFRSLYEADIVKGNAAAALDLKEIVRPFILRRLKSTVLKELPPKTETEMTIPLCDEQKEIYSKHLAIIKKSLESGEKKDRITILSMITKLRQICCDPTLTDENYAGNSEKLEICINLLKNTALTGGKALMFSQFTSMIKIVARKLDEENIRYFILEGATNKKERSRLIEKFNSDDTPVFLISLRAGGTGINLTGADTVIHYDPWWNDPVMNQATDRAYRIGQKKSVQVYKLIMKDSIEEKIVTLRQKKSALAGLFVDDENALPIGDLINLLL